MLRKIRILLATVMMIGITWLFLDFTGTAYHWLGWMPKIQLLEALLAGSVIIVLLLTVLTLVLGRIYCSVICPLGIMMDIFGRRTATPTRLRRNGCATPCWQCLSLHM